MISLTRKCTIYIPKTKCVVSAVFWQRKTFSDELMMTDFWGKFSLVGESAYSTVSSDDEIYGRGELSTHKIHIQ